jgi:hypothetical protein
MERRRISRKVTRVALQARAHRRAVTVQLYDLSPIGCRIDCSTASLSRGDRIVLKFADHIRVVGRIAWLRGGTAGVHFEAPLPDTITCHLRIGRPNAGAEGRGVCNHCGQDRFDRLPLASAVGSGAIAALEARHRRDYFLAQARFWHDVSQGREPAPAWLSDDRLARAGAVR